MLVFIALISAAKTCGFVSFRKASTVTEVIASFAYSVSSVDNVFNAPAYAERSKIEPVLFPAIVKLLPPPIASNTCCFVGAFSAP